MYVLKNIYYCFSSTHNLGILCGITILWVSEGLPYFVTSLCIPILVICFGVIDPSPKMFNDNNTTFPLNSTYAVDASHWVLTHMFDHVTFLILGKKNTYQSYNI